MKKETLDSIRAGYDTIAGEYAAHLYHELDGKPLDREWLDRFAEMSRNKGVVCDLGCGPGHVTQYLHARGVRVFGLDLSPEMVGQARRLNPEIEFVTGNMLALDAADASWAGIVAMYAMVNIPREDLPAVFGEYRRVLMPEGRLMLAFHLGTETIHREELWGQPVSLDFLFFEREEIETLLRQAGFDLIESIERDPYEEVEYPSRRCYILAQKAGFEF